MSFALIELSSLAPIKAKLTGFRKVLYSWEKKSAKSAGKSKRSLHPFQLIIIIITKLVLDI